MALRVAVTDAEDHDCVMAENREYVGYIWIGDDPGIRPSISATNVTEAHKKLVERYGEGHVSSVWNEADASRPR